MEQLGPFHFFFTLSAAEKRWSEVTTSIASNMGKKITYENGWEEDDMKIKIDDIPLPTYKEKIRHKSGSPCAIAETAIPSKEKDRARYNRANEAAGGDCGRCHSHRATR